MLTPERYRRADHSLRDLLFAGGLSTSDGWIKGEDKRLQVAAHLNIMQEEAAALRARVAALEGPGGEGWAERAVQMERQRDEALARVAALEEAGAALVLALGGRAGVTPKQAVARWREASSGAGERLGNSGRGALIPPSPESPPPDAEARAE